MKRRMLNTLLLTLLVMGSAALTPAQSTQAPKTAATPATATPAAGFRAEFMRQLDDMEKKYVDLAQAVPQEKYAWRPGEGVRSMSEVFMHLAVANFFIPQFVGAKPPAGIDRNMERTVTDKTKVVEMLKQSFDHVRQAAMNTPETDLDKPATFFGRATTVRDVFFTMATHMHEHLGQSIAYARMNSIVPPWTAARATGGPPRPRQ
ncbi:MAG: DinB family protein [Pyrinomonadaceae bacterium]|nr:DinB family protein [Pyrinomonadaceae bacterium]